MKLFIQAIVLAYKYLSLFGFRRVVLSRNQITLPNNQPYRTSARPITKQREKLKLPMIDRNGWLMPFISFSVIFLSVVFPFVVIFTVRGLYALLLIILVTIIMVEIILFMGFYVVKSE